MESRVEQIKAKDLEHSNLWEAYWRNPESKEALTPLLENWLPLVHHVLDRMTMRLPSNVSTEDLLQTGILGLYQAIERFNPVQGQRFEAFAYRRVRGAILDELRSLDHMSRSRRTLMKKVDLTIREWIEEHGVPPSHDEISEALNMKPGELNTLLEQAQPWLSLDVSVGGVEDEGLTWKEFLPDPKSKMPDEEAEREDLRMHLRQSFLKLSMREQKVLYLYYFEELRLSEIARLFDLTEARICQIHALAVAKLRGLLRQADRR